MTRARETDEIKALLMTRAESLVRELLPDGRRSGGYWIARNPSRDDRHAGSFYVWITGAAAGAWRDDATGQKGDVFGLIQLVEGCDFKAALTWSRAWLGLDGLPAPERRKRIEQAEQRQRAATADEVQKAAKARKTALAIYLEARKRPFVGSPADVYLKARGIDVESLGRMPGVLGWLPAHRHHETDTTWPAMIAGFTGACGAIVAVHRTFLDHNGSAKAPVSPARKIWPSFGGAAIRLWRGGSRLSVEDAERQGLIETLVLVEGVEDGLSVAVARPDLRVWCAGSLGNLAAISLPRCVDRVIVCADNDWGKPQAEAQLDKAVAHLARQGAEVSVARSHIGKDVNDALASFAGAA